MCVHLGECMCASVCGTLEPICVTPCFLLWKSSSIFHRDCITRHVWGDGSGVDCEGVGYELWLLSG